VAVAFIRGLMQFLMIKQSQHSTRSSSLLWALPALLQFLPGCALTGVSDYSGTSHYSLNHQQNDFAAGYGHTADYGNFAEQAENAEAVTRNETHLVSAAYEPPSTAIPGDPVWPVSLLEAVQLALDNNEVIPVNVEFLSTSIPLLNTPQAVASVYDPVIQATSVAGARGSLAATADFVPVLTARSTYGQDSVVQNNLVSAGLPAGGVLESNTGNAQVSLQQRLMTGGSVQISHNVAFDENNVTSNLFPNVYQGQLAVEFNQPLWGGAGDFFTSVAGPVDLISTQTPSVDQGIVITRINENISQNQFQIALRQLVKDVTDVYQDLHLVHRRHEIESRARDAAETIWKRLQAKSDAGTGDGLAAEAQSEESYYAAEARVKDVAAEITLTENRLRRLIGQAPGRGHVLLPSQPVAVDSIVEDWEYSLQTAFSRRPELNETVMTMQSLELQRSAAMSLSKPRLDLVSNIHTNGFGDRPFDESSRGGPARTDSFAQSLLSAEQTGWFAGVQFSVPLDQRRNRSLQHQLEYQLARSRATLKAQKKEISHELWHAFRSAERWAQLVAENKRRVEAARRQVSALNAAFPTGRVSVDLLVRAQSTLAIAETEYARAMTEYSKANSEIRFRRGTLLEDLHIGVQGQ
jgi:outer membrane protein TolC